MAYLQLNFTTARDYDEGALGVLYRGIAALRRKRLIPEEVRDV